MSKKRVHEIAKELKAQGIELDNKEVVSELLALVRRYNRASDGTVNIASEYLEIVAVRR